MKRSNAAAAVVLLILAASCVPATSPEPELDLSPISWQADYNRHMQAQLVDRESAGVATGMNGAVTVAYNGLAARAGLEALEQGGNAMDAAMTTAMTQVALTAGAADQLLRHSVAGLLRGRDGAGPHDERRVEHGAWRR